MLAELVEQATINPLVVNTARMIVSPYVEPNEPRTEKLEWKQLNAIFNAVKSGDPNVKPLARGFKYVNDPRYADYFASPVDTINNCLKGACAGDCDEHAALLCALSGAVGFRCALRAWGPKNESGYSHVYAMAAFPKANPRRWVPMDTTVPSSTLGWEPPRGNVLNAIFT